MNVTTSTAPKSRLQLDFELPPERLSRAMDEAVRRLSRRTRIPGFRPGKAPRVMLERVLGPDAIRDDAVDHLVEDSYREHMRESDIVPLASPDVEVIEAEEGKPFRFRVLVAVRPDVALGDYRHFNFSPEIETVDDGTVDRVVDELRDQHATLAPVEERGAQKGDYAVIGYTGTIDGEPFAGGSAERMPLVLGDERLIPGFEDQLVGLGKGEEREFDATFPDDYQEESLRGKTAHFTAELKELREKVMPAADDDFARAVGNFDDLAGLRTEVRGRLERNALDHARHAFSDRIIEYATANATVELPDVLIDQEVEIMHDELRSALARQGISEDVYLKVSNKTEDDLHKDFRPQAEKRVKVLLVLTKIGQQEGIEISDGQVEAEVDRARRRYAESPRLVRYFESERGRNYIRSTLRRTVLVEQLVDEWLAAHPDFPRLPHLEEDEAASAVGAPAAEANAAVDATDPGSIPAAAVTAAAAAEAIAPAVPEAGAEPAMQAAVEPATGAPSPGPAE